MQEPGILALPLGWDGRALGLLLPAMTGGLPAAHRTAKCLDGAGIYLMNEVLKKRQPQVDRDCSLFCD